MLQSFTQSLMTLDYAVLAALLTLALSFTASIVGLTRVALEAVRGK